MHERRSLARAEAVLAILCGALAACGDQRGGPDCIQPPCPLALAIELSVTSQAGGPVAGVTGELFGTATGSLQCAVEGSATRCRVPGARGTYQLRVAAPGFRSTELTVVVAGTDAPRCGCPTVQTQQVDLVLVPL